MQNLFIKENEEFTVNVVVATDKRGSLYCDIDEENLRKSIEGLVSVEECEINKYSVRFKKPSFGDTLNLYDSIFSLDQASSVRFNPALARLQKIMALIREWDLTDDRKFKKPTEDEVKKLHPIIANAIGIQVDVETGGILS